MEAKELIEVTPVIRRAVVSVYDKREIEPFCRELVRRGVELISTGGTYRALEKAGIPAIHVEAVTGFPEVLGGRVKSLHPRVHGGILARRDHPRDMEELASHGIEPIDLVVVNLYPFAETVRRGASFDECMEQIDIGGPAMIRAAAKNHRYVAVVVRPERYGEVLRGLDAGGLDEAFRRRLAAEAFAHTAAYDAAIRAYLEAVEASVGEGGIGT